tara:strand:- start:725 stop:1105 length:381 start_codon:yes stop_codon:yes gene_type:complete
MKILGLGIDIIDIRRIKKNINNKKFINRIFTSTEIKNNKNKNKEMYYAKRYAVKEAFSKALGTGFRDQLNFKNIEIKNDKLGKPYITKNITLNKLIKKKFKISKYNIFLSISDEKNYALANVIITK